MAIFISLIILEVQLTVMEERNKIGQPGRENKSHERLREIKQRPELVDQKLRRVQRVIANSTARIEQTLSRLDEMRHTIIEKMSGRN